MQLLKHSTSNGEEEGAARWCNEHGRTWHSFTWTNEEYGLDEVLGCGCQRYFVTPCAQGHMRPAGRIEYTWQAKEETWLWSWPCGCVE